MSGRVTIPLDVLDTMKDPMTLRFFLWCLVQATATEFETISRGQHLTLSPGQLIFNRRRATAELEDYGFTERKVRTALTKCIASQYLSQNVSHKVTVLSVTNFSTYEIVVEASVPINVPKSDPKRQCKTGQTTKNTLINNTKNTTGMKNKDKHPTLHDAIQEVFLHYRKTFPTFGRTVRPGHKDWNRIGDRIKDGYSVEECIFAVNGNSVDEWYKAKGLHSIRYIFRDSDLMDRFILTWKNYNLPVISDKAKRSLQAAQSWVNLTEETHGSQ